MKFMQHNLLTKSFFSLIVVAFLLIGTSFAQTSNPKTRRNSPFAPNPKKRTEIAKATDSDLRIDPAAQKVTLIEPSVKKDEQTANVKVVETAKPNDEKVNSADESKGEGDAQLPLADNSGSANIEKTSFEKSPVAEKVSEPAEKLKTSVEPSDIYKVGAGDVLYISLQNAPEKESTYFTVSDDGAIDYPLAGEMTQVKDLTADEIASLLEGKIKLYENPQISVKVREHNSHHYTVAGMVEKPGEKSLQREAYPLIVVRAEAVAQPKADRAVIKRSGGQVETVDLKDVKSEDVLIYAGDRVEFGSSETDKQFFYIGGEITSGGQKDYLAGMTLTQAILASGGLKKQSVKKVVIRRKNEAGMLSPINYDLKAIKDGKSADPEIKAGDTIEIGN